MSGAAILVVDDELHIRRLLRTTLERAGYAVAEAVDAAAALHAAEAGRPAAILLDLGLPDRDGLELIGLLKRHGDPVVIVVSAREATDHKVTALDLGAEDYVTKPFDTEELLARLRAALRGKGIAGRPPSVLRRGGVEIDLERRLVRRHGEEIHLTRKEHAVLCVLAAHPGRVITHQKIMDAAWPRSHDKRIEYLRIVVRNLRQKIEGPAEIGTVIANELGVGYRLLTDDGRGLSFP